MLDRKEIEKANSALWYGLFLLNPLEGELSRPIENQHVTFGYKVEPPSDMDWNAFYVLEIDGYGNNGENEGYRCRVPEDLAFAYFGAEVPHITVSLAEGAKAKDTAELEFEDIEPFTITGKFGYFSRGEYVI